MLFTKDGSQIAVPDAVWSGHALTLDASPILLPSGPHHLLPYTLENYRALRSAGVAVQSPIRTQYQWSGRYTPFEHQKNIASFLTLHHKAFVLADMGAGKTHAALWAMDYLMRMGEVKRVLILCTLSTLVEVWERTLFFHFPHLTTYVVHGSAKKKLTTNHKQHQHTNVFIANHELTRSSDRMLFQRELPVDLLIVDEGAEYREAKTQKYRGLRALSLKIPKIWWLTATPTPDAPTDAWAQAVALGTAQGMTFAQFREATMYKEGLYRWQPKRGATELVKRVLSPAIRYKLEDCVDLPGITYTTRRADMTPAQAAAYTKLKNESVIELQQAKITAVNEAVKANKLLQVASGIVYDDTGQERHVEATHKLGILEEVIVEAGTPIIAFVPFRSVAHFLYERFKARYSSAVVLGDVNLADRTSIFSRFQKGEIRLLIAHPKTMSHGLTLTSAATIVWVAPIWSNNIYTQANARIYRPGQTRHCTIVNLVSSQVETEIYQRLKDKQTLQGALLDMLTRDQKSV